jgi:uncharacterized protein (UPF0261 family)
MGKSIVIISSLDTKAPEAQFLKDRIEQEGLETILMDTSMRGEPKIPPDIPCEDVAKAGGSHIEEIRTSDRPMDEITSIMTQGAIKKVLELYEAGKLDGIIAVGGVSNTVMGTDIMKALPFGVPKLMASSGAAMPSYAGGFFGSSDLVIMSSVVDMSGLHELGKSVLIRAAGAICGMVKTGAGAVGDALKESGQYLIGMSTFHYAEKCCDLVGQYLEKRGYTVIACHAQGVGDRAMDKLLSQKIFNGVLDIVPSGLSEEMLGGNRAAGPNRLDVAGEGGLPQVITPCGFDMISCGPVTRKDRNDPLWVSRKIADRNYYVHDGYRVQARTSAGELRLIAKAVAEKLNRAKGPVKFLIPTKGWSSLSVENQPLYDPDADMVFVEELKKNLSDRIEVRELDLELNSPEFATAIVEAFDGMMQGKKTH